MRESQGVATTWNGVGLYGGKSELPTTRTSTLPTGIDRRGHIRAIEHERASEHAFGGRSSDDCETLSWERTLPRVPGRFAPYPARRYTAWVTNGVAEKVCEKTSKG